MIYLRARYYDTALGRFITADTHWNVDNMIYGDNNTGTSNISAILQSSNLYVYCSNNPIIFIDVTGNAYQVKWIRETPGKSFTYNRNSAVAYSQDWFDKRNPAYPDKGGHDCANFVSQCLFAGGMPVTNKWKNYVGLNRKGKKVLKLTDAWANARKQYDYFSKASTGVGKYIITVYSSGDVKDAANSGCLKVGDTLYFSNGGTDSIYHAAIIAGISDGEIYYAAHSDDHSWKALGNSFFKEQEAEESKPFNAVYIMHFFTEGS